VRVAAEGSAVRVFAMKYSAGSWQHNKK